MEFIEAPSPAPVAQAVNQLAPRPRWPPLAPVLEYEKEKFPPFSSIVMSTFSFQKVPEKTALFFDIIVSIGDSSYTITRRYAHLKLLHEWVEANIPGLQLKPLPTKLGTFFVSREAEAKKRQIALQAFFHLITQIKWFGNLLFIRKFFSNNNTIAFDEPEYPECGLLYIQVLESKGLQSFGVTRLKIQPAFSFGKGSAVSSFITKQLDPSGSTTDIYQEFVHSISKRSLQTLLISVVDTHPAEHPRGPFCEIDIAKLAPFQMYEIEQPFHVQMTPRPTVRLMLQWNPTTMEAPIKYVLPSARVHIHSATLAPGDVLRGVFVLCNDMPRPCSGIVLNLRCRQTAEFQEIREIKGARTGKTLGYKAVKHNASVELAHSRRTLFPSFDLTKSPDPYPPDLPAGFFCWPFEFAIPVDAPPSTQVPESVMVRNEHSGTIWTLDSSVGIQNFPQPKLNIEVIQVFDEEDEKRIAGEEMESAGNETIVNGVGLRVVSRDGWLWNTGEIRSIEVMIRAVQVKEIVSANARVQAHVLLFATRPLKHATTSISPDPLQPDSNATYSSPGTSDGKAVYGVSTAVNKKVGEYVFDEKITQGNSVGINIVIPVTDDIPATFSRSLSSPLLSCSVALWVDVQCISVNGKKETVSIPIPLFISGLPTRIPLCPSPPATATPDALKATGYGLPHMPLQYFHKYPSQPLLGRTPLLPPSSWFFPLSLEPNYPLCATNLVTLPSSTFHQAHVVLPNLPTFDELVTRLKDLSSKHSSVRLLIDEIEEMKTKSSDSVFAGERKGSVPVVPIRSIRLRGESIASANSPSAVFGATLDAKQFDKASIEVLRNTFRRDSISLSAGTSEIVMETQVLTLPDLPDDNPFLPENMPAASSSTDINQAPPQQRPKLESSSRLSILVSEALKEAPVQRFKVRGSMAVNASTHSLSTLQQTVMAAEKRATVESARESTLAAQPPLSLRDE